MGSRSYLDWQYGLFWDGYKFRLASFTNDMSAVADLPMVGTIITRGPGVPDPPRQPVDGQQLAEWLAQVRRCGMSAVFDPEPWVTDSR